jgi:hypothetical protein
MAVLSAAEIERAIGDLERDGYVVFEGVVPEEPLDAFAHHLLDEYQRAKAEHRLFEGGGTVSGHLNCFPGERSRFIYDAIVDYGIVDIVRAWAPDDVHRLRATTNFNLPGSYPQHYHSDGLYTEAFLICNVAVVDTDLTNGAIDVLPGTHHRFYKFWQYAAQRKYRDSKRLCMRRGDVLLRISTMWHRGMPNSSPYARPLMSLTFGEDSAADIDPLSDTDSTSAFEGNVQFTPNWYGTNRVAQVREHLFIRAPWTYSSYRFVRSLVGNKGYSSW